MIRFIRPLCLAFSLAIVAASVLPPTATATEFSLRAREPGPGHPLRSFWWHFNGASWELSPPDGYTLTGGGEIRLTKEDRPGATVACRATTGQEADLLRGDDEKAQAAYVRTLLPGGITNIKLAGQSKNPLAVNGLSNFEVTYTYDLGGSSIRYTVMVSQGGERDEQNPPTPGQPTPAPTPTPKPAPDGKPVRTGEFFTTVIAGPEASYADLSSGFDQLMAGAKVLPGTPTSDANLQYSSHGMLGR